MKGNRRWSIAVVAACAAVAALIGYFWPRIAEFMGPLYGPALGSAGLAATVLLGGAAVSGRIDSYLERVRAAAERITTGDSSPLLLQSIRRDLGAAGTALAMTAERLRRKIEESSAEKERLERILESMSDGVLAADSNRRISMANQAACRLLCEGVASLLGRSTELLPEVIRESVDRVMGGGSAPLRPLTLDVPQRGAVELRVTALPLKDDNGALVGVLVMLQDMTEQARVDRLRRDFVANASHELRTPVTSIRMLAEGIRAESESVALSDRASDFVTRLATESERLTRLASDLLDLSLIEDVSSSSPVPLNLSEICQDSVTELAALAESRQARLDLFVGEAARNLRVLADRRSISAAVSNLIENALSHGRHSGGHVTVNLAAAAGSAILTVADDGPGIPIHDQERIFERFYRVDKARSRDTGGTGLGLSIVRNAVEAAGGTVALESEAGKGAVFTVTLPAMHGQ